MQLCLQLNFSKMDAKILSFIAIKVNHKQYHEKFVKFGVKNLALNQLQLQDKITYYMCMHGLPL